MDSRYILIGFLIFLIVAQIGMPEATARRVKITKVETEITYNSSYDNTTNLKADIKYNVSNNNVPILVMVHGHTDLNGSGTAMNMSAEASDFAFNQSYPNYFVIVPEMRGRNGSGGSVDTNGMELYDIIDAVEFIKSNSTYQQYIDANTVFGYGISQGAAALYTLSSRFPQYFKAIAPYFGISDFEIWYSEYPSVQADLNIQIGGTPSQYPDRYHSRSLNSSHHNAYNNLRVPILAYHGIDDLVVPSHHTSDVANATTGNPNQTYNIWPNITHNYNANTFTRPFVNQFFYSHKNDTVVNLTGLNLTILGNLHTKDFMIRIYNHTKRTYSDDVGYIDLGRNYKVTVLNSSDQNIEGNFSNNIIFSLTEGNQSFSASGYNIFNVTYTEMQQIGILGGTGSRVIEVNNPQKNEIYNITVKSGEVKFTFNHSIKKGALYDLKYANGTVIETEKANTSQVSFTVALGYGTYIFGNNYSVYVTYVPWTATTQGWTTPYVIANKGTSNATVDISYYNYVDGSLIADYSMMIVPNSSRFVFREWSAAGTDGSAAVVSDQPVTAVVEQLNNVENKFGPYEVDPQGSTDVFLPLTLTTGGWTTPYAVVNRGTLNAAVNITYYHTNGSSAGNYSLTILPGASNFVFREWTTGAAGTDGAARITSDQPISVLVDMFQNAQNKYGAYIPASVADTKVFLPWTATTQGWTTPFNIVNRGTVNAVVNISYYNAATGLVAGNATVSIAPNEVVTVSRENSSANGTDGSAVIDSTQNVSVIVQQFNNVEGKFEVYTPAMNASTRIVIPWTATTQGWTTPYVIANRGSSNASVTISYYNSANGSYAGNYSLVIVPNSSSFVFREWSAAGTDGSALVVSDQPITVVVDQLNNVENKFGAYTPIG